MSSPAVRNRSGKVIHRPQKLMVINAYKSIMSTKPDTSLKKTISILSDGLGIGTRSLYYILKTYSNSGELSASLSYHRKCETIAEKMSGEQKSRLRKAVHNFYFRNELPTLDKVLTEIKEDPNLPTISRATLHRVLRRMKFKYAKRNRSSLLIESDHIRCWRHEYLRSIREYRDEGRQIYYMDETWLNANHTLSKCWIDETVLSAEQAKVRGLSVAFANPPHKGKRLIITHIGSNCGFVDGGLMVFEAKGNGDYHEEMNTSVFESWFESILPELEAGAVIVMDNAPYHCRKKIKIPNSATKKADMVTWLAERGVDVDPSTHLKPELLRLIKGFGEKETYYVDELARATGRYVLRLPPYHCELYPIELIWASVKTPVARKNPTSMALTKQFLLEGLEQTTPSTWRKCIQHVVEKVERRMWEIDHLLEQRVEELIIQFDDSDGDDDSDAVDSPDMVP